MWKSGATLGLDFRGWVLLRLGLNLLQEGYDHFFMEADEDNIIIIIFHQEVKRQYEKGKTKPTKTDTVENDMT